MAIKLASSVLRVCARERVMLSIWVCRRLDCAVRDVVEVLISPVVSVRDYIRL